MVIRLALAVARLVTEVVPGKVPVFPLLLSLICEMGPGLYTGSGGSGNELVDMSVIDHIISQWVETQIRAQIAPLQAQNVLQQEQNARQQEQNARQQAHNETLQKEVEVLK